MSKQNEDNITLDVYVDDHYRVVIDNSESDLIILSPTEARQLSRILSRKAKEAEEARFKAAEV